MKPRVVRSIHIWTCCDQEHYTLGGLKIHLFMRHGIKGTIPNTRFLVLHIDTPDTKFSDYIWDIGKLTFHELVITRRPLNLPRQSPNPHCHHDLDHPPRGHDQ